MRRDALSLTAAQLILWTSNLQSVMISEKINFSFYFLPHSYHKIFLQKSILYVKIVTYAKIPFQEQNLYQSSLIPQISKS